MQFVLALQLSLMSCAYASDIVMPLGSQPCEADWINRSRFDSVGTESQLHLLELAASKGNATAQLGLGMVRRTRDGKWQAPPGFNKIWLEKAANAGSLTAAARLAEWQQMEQIKNSPPTITYSDYLHALMRAAQEEGDTLSATTLMQLTSRRFGDPKSCSDDLKKQELCDPDTELLPPSDARKWATIAAEGGNPDAQAKLCYWAYDGFPIFGQPKDNKEAYKWCLIASRNMCELSAVGRLDSLLREGRGSKKDTVNADHWRNAMRKQPWRAYGNFFYTPATSH
jgi:TPR repeat protein